MAVSSKHRVIIAACLFAAASSSQTPPAFRSNVELVAIPCSVLDARGAPVSGLTREDFVVYDNGTRRTIENLWFDNDSPLTIGVIVDGSESQQEQLAEHRQTAVDLLERILRSGDRAFAVAVNGEIRLWADLSSTAAEFRARMAGPRGAGFGPPCPMRQCGSSPLWDAIYETARLKFQSIPGNKAMLILTDGFDSGSLHTWRQAVDEAHRADSIVYAIQYRSGMGGRFAPDLYRMVEETGGATFNAPRGDYGPIVSRIETDLRARYVLGFRPEMLSGKLRHEVRVEVNRPELTVRARRAYFRPQ